MGIATEYIKNKNAQTIKDMKPLFLGAREAGLWFHIQLFDESQYWFSPDELEAEQKNGHHLHTPALWVLIDPMLKVKSMEKRIELYTEQLEAFKRRVK